MVFQGPNEVFQRGSDEPCQVLLRKQDEDGELTWYHGVHHDPNKSGFSEQ